MKRRTLLKASIAAGAGLLIPGQVLAKWPASAFEAKGIDAALTASVGTGSSTESDKVKIKAPDIAENGAVVPVTVSTTLDGVESISILAEKNATPLIATFVLGEGAEGYAATRIKMGKTSNVIVAVKANGKLYSATKEVKVTIGGCGG
ncbi:MAG: thiosulfate oxidation carrier protein SoxY [Gammaproteobacteria bacterium]